MKEHRNLSKLVWLFSLSLIVACSVSGCVAESKTSYPARSDGTGLRKDVHRNAKSQAHTSNYRSKANIEDSKPVSLMATTKPIRAIYVTSYVANSKRINELIDLVNQTELNAMVLDINSGITLSSPVRTGDKTKHIQAVLSNKKSAQHFRQVIKQLKQNRIYLIARIVAFKNPTLVNAMPAWALKRNNGEIWYDRNGIPWIDPYRQEAWEYPLTLAEQAAQMGFDEVQYDYVRFPENAAKVDREVAYANRQGWTKSEAISRFLHRANLRTHKYGIRLSADVFGMVGSSDDDMGIGQKWDSIVKEVDVISPMIYPSHYSEGMWGIDYPDLNPGPIVMRALKDTVKHNRKLNQQGIATAKVRPWLQGFTAGWIHPHQKYGGAQIREQILAARKAGFNSYMIWNSANRYPEFTT